MKLYLRANNTGTITWLEQQAGGTAYSVGLYTNEAEYNLYARYDVYYYGGETEYTWAGNVAQTDNWTFGGGASDKTSVWTYSSGIGNANSGTSFRIVAEICDATLNTARITTSFYSGHLGGMSTTPSTGEWTFGIRAISAATSYLYANSANTYVDGVTLSGTTSSTMTLYTQGNSSPYSLTGQGPWDVSASLTVLGPPIGGLSAASNTNPTAQRYLKVFCVSYPLLADVTISDCDFALGFYQSDALLDTYPQVHIWVTEGSGAQALRGTLLSSYKHSTEAYTVEIESGFYVSNLTCTPVQASAGDRIVVEYGYDVDTGGTGTTKTWYGGSPGSFTALPESNGGDPTASFGWFRFSLSEAGGLLININKAIVDGADFSTYVPPANRVFVRPPTWKEP